MRESRTYGSVRGQCREALVYSTCGEIESMHEFEVAELINLPFEEKTVILYKNKKTSIIHQFKYKVKRISTDEEKNR